MFTASYYKKFANKTIDNKTKEKKSVNEPNISWFIDNSDLDKKIAMVATKAELKAKKDTIVYFQTFESSSFQDKIYFEDDGTQNYCFSKSISVDI